MARARNIKPGFYKNEDLAECSIWARFIFPGLWMLADRDGRLEDRPKRIKGELLTYDSVDVEPLLDELSRFGFIVRYEVDGQKYIQINKFSQHQSPHVREQASSIPAPPDAEQGTAKVVPNTTLGSAMSSPGSPESLFSDSLNPSSLNPDSPSSVPDGTVADDKAANQHCPATKIVDAYHRLMPDNPRCKVLNNSRKGAIKARWNEAAKLTCKPFGYATVQDGVAAWERFFATCAESPFLTGKATPQPGKPPFVAGIDFLMSPEAFAKCLENYYHRVAI